MLSHIGIEITILSVSFLLCFEPPYNFVFEAYLISVEGLSTYISFIKYLKSKFRIFTKHKHVTTKPVTVKVEPFFS